MRRISVIQPDRRRGVSIARITAPGIFIGLMLLMSSCIRPNDTPPTATPGGPIMVTPPVIVTQTTPGVIDTNLSINLIRMEAFVQSYGAQPIPGSTRIWVETIYLQDLVVGIAFQNQSGLNCIGVGIGNHDGGQNSTGLPNLINVFNGGYHCVSTTTDLGVAGQWLITDSRGTPLIIFAGQAFAPNAQSVVLLYPDGTQRATPLTSGSFLFMETSLNFPSEVSIRDAADVELGRIAIPVSPQG
ncbi:MAG: hypothetical protein F9K46_10735 [Anaerolineae bacterium]|nr:MAG: hypothetical protein F9K46_10735 [Anaerolineae bacterium]